MKLLLRSIPIVALVAAGPMVSACQKSKSPDLESRVQNQLKDNNLKDVNANWKKDENTLHLTGKVDDAAQKQRAEELADQVVGTSGRVVNEVEIKGVDNDDVDNRIEKELDQMFKEDPQWDKDTNDLAFHSKAGVVTITGDAQSQDIKDRVGAKVRSVEGVKDVVNDVQVKPAKGSAAGTAHSRPNKKY